MARKEEYVTVPLAWGARDAGKVFKITEMPAAQAEKWFVRAVIALKGTSAFIPENLAAYGTVILTIRGINSFLAADVDYDKLEPILDEMFSCVQIVRDVNARDAEGRMIATNLAVPDDIEEVRTRGWLRSEVLRVHTNFSVVDGLSSWVSRIAAALPKESSPPT